jgi:glyoxylate reductase
VTTGQAEHVSLEGHYDRRVAGEPGRPRVVITRRVPGDVRDALEASFEVRLHDSLVPPARAELLRLVGGADGLVTMLTDRVDDELFDAAGPQLRVVANYAVGLDNVDVDAARRRGVVVANTPDVLTVDTAQLTLALLLALARRVAEGDRFLRAGEEWSWAPTFMLGTSLRGRTLGIVGLGRIGTEVARLAEAFGMRVVHFGGRAPEGSAYEADELDELLRRADVVSLHCPLTPETRHLIDEAALEAMQPHALLVNTARGPVVDERALARALERGTIAGAALDVFEDEPAVYPPLLRLSNVVLTPHLASATADTRSAMGRLCVEALRAVLLDNRIPPNAVQ